MYVQVSSAIIVHLLILYCIFNNIKHFKIIFKRIYVYIHEDKSTYNHIIIFVDLFEILSIQDTVQSLIIIIIRTHTHVYV